MKKAFTLVELLVVIAIIAVLVAILVPVIGSALRDANRSGCQANLKSIGTGILEYGRANNNAFPRLPNSNANITNNHGNPWTAWGVGAADTDACTATHMNNVWMMIDAGTVPVTGFKCPADDNYTSRTATTLVGWTANTQFSFGLHYVYALGSTSAGVATATVNPADPTREYDDSLAATAQNGIRPNQIIMADKNPVTTGGLGGTAAANGQSNHDQDGVSYLTKSGNVAFFAEAASSVINGNDIYLCDAAAATDIHPQTNTDVFIVPDP